MLQYGLQTANLATHPVASDRGTHHLGRFGVRDRMG